MWGAKRYRVDPRARVILPLRVRRRVRVKSRKVREDEQEDGEGDDDDDVQAPEGDAAGEHLRGGRGSTHGRDVIAAAGAAEAAAGNSKLKSNSNASSGSGSGSKSSIEKEWREWSPFLPFTEALAFARSLSLVTAREWEVWAAGAGRPGNIPTRPDRVYKRAGWIGYGHWLGASTSETAHHMRGNDFMAFDEALALARSLQLARGNAVHATGNGRCVRCVGSVISPQLTRTCQGPTQPCGCGRTESNRIDLPLTRGPRGRIFILLFCYF